MAIHEEYVELISAAVDGTLTEAEAARLQSHLAQCADCRGLLRDMQNLHAALCSLPTEEPPADLSGRILSSLAEDNVTPFPAKRTGGWKRWAGSAAVIALILAGAWGFWGSTDKVTGGDMADSLPPITAEGAGMNDAPEDELEGLAAPEIALSDPLPDQAAPEVQGRSAPVPQPTRSTAGQAVKPAAKAAPQTQTPVETASAVETPAPAQGPMVRSMMIPVGDSGAEDAPEEPAEVGTMQVAAPQPFMASVPLPSEASEEVMDAEVPESVMVTAANALPPVSAESLTPRQALERIVAQEGFTGYTWVDDDTVSIDPRSSLSRMPAILWIDGAESITYLNYQGLSDQEDYHTFKMERMVWDNDPANSACPHGTAIPLTRYSVPVTGEGEILIEDLEGASSDEADTAE